MAGRAALFLFLDGAEEAEEFRIRVQHHRRAFTQGLAVGFHGPVEIEELRVLAEGLAENSVARALALAAQDFRLALGLGDDNGAVLVGDGLNL